MTVGHQETPSPYTAYGIKGAGEGGRMLTPAIMSAAIEDALVALRRHRHLAADLGRADRGVGRRRALIGVPGRRRYGSGQPGRIMVNTSRTRT